MNELLGNRIKNFRTTRNLTQEQIATQIGVSRQKYARIEKGTNNITLDILAKIAPILDVTVSDITKVLDDNQAIAYRGGGDSSSTREIFEMIDLFYANKRMCNKLKSQHSND